MKQMAHRAALAAALLLCCGGAQAQVGRNYDVKPMNFDLWCQGTAHIDPDRCDKRLPADDEAFQAYRAKIEAYEIPYLKQQNRNLRIDTDILHNDPTDRSSTRAIQTQGQQTSQTPVRTDAIP
jgi:hypothetical protein